MPLNRKKSRRAKSFKGRGGFIPSVMTGVAQAAPYFMTTAVVAGHRLVENDKERMALRSIASKGRRPRPGAGTRKRKRATRRRL